MYYRRWMLTGPEVSRLILQFDNQYLTDNDPENPENYQNHETGKASQAAFQRQVKNLSDVMRTMGNPFNDDFPELVKLDTRDCVDHDVSEALRTLEEVGNRQLAEYQKKVVVDRTVSINEPIKKNNLPLFRKPRKKSAQKQAKISMLQNNVALFARLYIAMQSRGSDLKEFFSHEIQPFPPSLSELGKIRLPSAKSDLLKCLPSLNDRSSHENLSFDCRILDGAVIVHSLRPSGAVTFKDYAQDVFIPHLQYHLQQCQRLDIVWDTYLPESLKESTRDKRGTGHRRKVAEHVKIPTNWPEFLRLSTNKSELFQYLSSEVEAFDFGTEKSIFITSGNTLFVTINAIKI